MRRHPSINRPAIATLAMLLSLTATGLLAAPPANTPPPTSKPAAAPEARRDELPAGFDQRKQAIDASLKAKPATGWAGNYYEGNGRSTNIRLSLSPAAGAAATWKGCVGTYGANHGPLVQGKDGVIRMSFVAPNNPAKFGEFPGELVPVAWGPRQYLIPPDKIPEFVSAINRGFEPRKRVHGRFLLREGDEKLSVTGLPVLPPSTEAQVRRVPVEVKIAWAELSDRNERDGYCTSRYTIHVEPTAEASPPLFVGEELWPYSGSSTATVTASLGQPAKADVVVHDCDEDSAPKPGNKYTTGAYDEKKVGRL